MSLQEFSFIGSGLAGIAAVVGLSATVYQLRGLKKSVINSNLMAIFEIEFELNRRKERLAEIRQKNIEIIAGRTSTEISSREKDMLEALDSFRKEAFEDYLNIFDRLSYFILQKHLNEEDFRLEFRDMLFDTIENDEEKHFERGSRYRNMIKLYERWKDK